ncbi:PREDICTED: uncharacterized protein LOC104728711 [Camelina sativa]|uniref:Uncharacterized protein LOC104728711 n=1 Tax=Camelina sativa TaxID=90675 RepID=A0ABM1QLG3_CAMSA|nr:PREDICTED: uncharacterized protein LOC104728711 [Camelina sativa]
MENPQQLIDENNPLMLDAEHYDDWKAQIRQIIQICDMEAWFGVEDGWSHPTLMNMRGETVIKPCKLWMAEEKLKGKQNTEALSTIFSCLPMDLIAMVQECMSAKEAWDRLEAFFEETRRMRKNDQKAEESVTLKTVETQTTVQGCSTLKRRSVLKCYNRQGCGHTKSCLTWSDIDFPKEDDKNQKSVLKSNDEVACLSVEKQVIPLSKDLILQKKENYDLMSEKEELLCRVFALEKLLSEENVISSLLRQRLEDQLKNNKRLSKGRKDLDKRMITHKGTMISNGDMSNHGGNSSGDMSVVNRFKNRVSQLIRQKKFHKVGRRGNQVFFKKNDMLIVLEVGARLWSVEDLNKRTCCCYYASQSLHNVVCFKCLDCTIPLTHLKECHKDVRRYKRVNIKKRDMNCCVAHTVDDEQTIVLKHWFFDSGCLRHITGNQGRLHTFEKGSADKVTFGDEAEGKIRGKGASRVV